MVFDNSKENITDANQMMEFLAWNMELCMRTAQHRWCHAIYAYDGCFSL